MSSITQTTASSFSEAINLAVDKALDSYPWSDAQINWKLINISGQADGLQNEQNRVTVQISHGLTRQYLMAQAVELDEELAA
jgi:hypothetical protein